MFVRVWEFVPRPDRTDEFRGAYGGDGPWAGLFRRYPGFIGTGLAASLSDAERFLTIDCWVDAAAWRACLDDCRGEYDDLDRRSEALVASEREVGILRRARLDDAPAIAALSDELGYPNEAGAIRSRLAAVDARADELVLVAETAGGESGASVTGWVHVFGAARLESDPYAEIGGLIVTERARGGGIGQALLAAAETWARTRGYHDMRVRSNVVRERAHAFYRRCGYASPKVQRVFVKPLG
jgi:GNAT superfamily N-acetyltransferase